jgi:hypothetical protein
VDFQTIAAAVAAIALDQAADFVLLAQRNVDLTPAEANISISLSATVPSPIGINAFGNTVE